jgi:hypothetical protein
MAYQSGKRGGRPQGGRHSGGQGGRRGGRKGPAKKFIHPSKFINKAAAPAEETPYEPTHKFVDFPFGAELQHNIAQKATYYRVRFRISQSRTLLKVRMLLV